MAGYQSSNVLSIFRDLTGQFDISHQTNISKLLGLRQKEPKYSSIYEYLKRDTREMREECETNNYINNTPDFHSAQSSRKVGRRRLIPCFFSGHIIRAKGIY